MLPCNGDPRWSRAHLRRLRQYWRSAGWPCLDNVEVDLLAAGLVRRSIDAAGRDSIQVTDAGVAALHQYLSGNRRRRDPHEALVEHVARSLVREGRLVYRGLRLRAQCDGRWAVTRPDVYSIRPTHVEAYLDPTVHEIKVRRADLLADLRTPTKRAAYQAVAREFYYVIADGVGDPAEIPEDCGVIVAAGDELHVVRPSDRRDVTWHTHQWVALARARCEVVDVEPEQLELGARPDDFRIDRLSNRQETSRDDG
jgi:hypothetical protein